MERTLSEPLHQGFGSSSSKLKSLGYSVTDARPRCTSMLRTSLSARTGSRPVAKGGKKVWGGGGRRGLILKTKELIATNWMQGLLLTYKKVYGRFGVGLFLM